MYCKNCSSEHFLPSDFIIYKNNEYCVSCFNVEEIEYKVKIKDDVIVKNTITRDPKIIKENQQKTYNEIFKK